MKYIDGYPGRYAVIARRHGETWYVACINAEKEPIKLTLDLTPLGLKGDTMTEWADRKGKELKAREVKVKNAAAVKVTIEPDGGVILRGE